VVVGSIFKNKVLKVTLPGILNQICPRVHEQPEAWQIVPENLNQNPALPAISGYASTDAYTTLVVVKNSVYSDGKRTSRADLASRSAPA